MLVQILVVVPSAGKVHLHLAAQQESTQGLRAFVLLAPTLARARALGHPNTKQYTPNPTSYGRSLRHYLRQIGVHSRRRCSTGADPPQPTEGDNPSAGLPADHRPGTLYGPASHYRWVIQPAPSCLCP